MRQSLALITPPAGEPLLLDEVKAWARIDGCDDDYVLGHLITAARTAAEEYLRRSLLVQTWKLTLDLDGGCEPWWDGVIQAPISVLYGDLPRSIPLLKGPASSITSVVTYDLSNEPSTYDPVNYRIDSSGERMILNFGAIWPANIRPQAGCEITYVAGYGDKPSNIPQPIKTGMMIHVASLYEQRGLCDDAMDLPPATKQLYGPYRILGGRRG